MTSPSYVAGAAMVGIEQLGDYATPTAGEDKVQVLLDLIHDPDSLTGSGREAGNNLDEMHPNAVAQLRLELLALQTEMETFNPTDDPTIAIGSYTADAADDTANETTIDSGLTTEVSFSSLVVSIERAGASVKADAVVTDNDDGTFTVGDGASTYDVTADDVITWAAEIA